MAERVVLHIGSMKSGTSFIQNVLGNNRDELAQHGISFAGERWRDQVAAVQDLIAHGGPNQAPLDPAGPWLRAGRRDQRRRPARSWCRWSSSRPASPARSRSSATPSRAGCEVVLTGRDLARNIAAMWLESVQNGSAVTWDDYLAAVRSEDSRSRSPATSGTTRAWPRSRRRWSDAVGADHFTLMTVPPKGAPQQPAVGALRAGPAARPRGLRAQRARQPVDRPGHRDDAAPPQRDPRPRRHAGFTDDKFYDLLVKHLLTKRGLVARQGRSRRSASTSAG